VIAFLKLVATIGFGYKIIEVYIGIDFSSLNVMTFFKIFK